MLSKYLTNVDPDKVVDTLDQLSALAGGYVLEITETIRVYPECCGSLKDIHEWKSASKYVKSEEEVLWIGHPWLMVSAIDEGHLRIRRTAEYGEAIEPVIFEIKRSDLELAVADAEEKLSKFQQVLLPIMKIMRNNAQEVLQVLING